MDDFKVNTSIPLPSPREAEIVYQVLKVDSEPSRSGVIKTLSVENNILNVSFTGAEPRKVRVALTSFFDNLILIIETIQQFGPSHGK